MFSYLTKYCIPSGKQIEAFITTLEKVKEKNPKLLSLTTFENLIEDSISSLEQRDILAALSKNPSGKFIIDLNVALREELMRYLQPAENKEANNLAGDKLKKTIKKLTESINTIQKMIEKAESVEISLDDMDKPTEFTQLRRLYNANTKLWKKREALLNRSDNTGRIIFGKFVYQDAGNNQVNEIVQKIYIDYLNSVKRAEDVILKNKKSKAKKPKKSKSDPASNFAFPDILEFKSILLREITKQKINFTLTDEKLLKMYGDLVKENKRRRLKEQFVSFNTVSTYKDIHPDSIADEKDPDFKKQMIENDKTSDEAMENELKKFREKDLLENGDLHVDNSREIGYDANDHQSETGSSDEEIESSEEEKESGDNQSEEIISSGTEDEGDEPKASTSKA